MRGRRSGIRFAGVLLAWLALIGHAAAERESFELRVPLAPAPAASEGRVRLFYELHLTNFSREPLRPVAIDVRGEDDLVLATFTGTALAARLAPAVPTAGTTDSTVIAPGARKVLYLELDLAPDAVPSRLHHRVAYRVEGAEALSHIEGAKVAPDPRPAPVLGPPLRGGPWAAVFDPAWPRGHRRVFYAVEGRATLPGRFAIDLVKLDAHGRLAAGDADLVRNAHAHGEPVLAVADATVVAMRGDYPEAARISQNGRHPLTAGSGNYVVLALGEGRHAIYEHLRPGSVRVAAGQRVRRGEVIGEVGYSGSGNWPHLHFHVADDASLLGGDGLPFAFEGFSVLGRYTDIEALGARPWTPHADPDTVVRRHERPADNSVLRFPD
ncbi:M23 family metallopeptidase [Luteimonas saliphila]|uniref:M23 family metallopeptidase n=1 Tax=Luteimonas saliphila TaxID=2804919 RepID=UPI00192D762E|nr:M23 family metallopeptidase [Luteimonas saliphila]